MESPSIFSTITSTSGGGGGSYGDGPLTGSPGGSGGGGGQSGTQEDQEEQEIPHQQVPLKEIQWWK
jgi:hypothetical protein